MPSFSLISPFANHLTRHGRGHLDVAGRAVGHITKKQFPRHAAPIFTARLHATRSCDWCICPSSGNHIVDPNDGPRGMIVTLWSGSVCGRSSSNSAWPAFVICRVLFFLSLRARLRRSLPQRTLSRASSNSASVIPFNPRRAASSAASLITLANSAPE